MKGILTLVLLLLSPLLIAADEDSGIQFFVEGYQATFCENDFFMNCAQLNMMSCKEKVFIAVSQCDHAVLLSEGSDARKLAQATIEYGACINRSLVKELSLDRSKYESCVKPALNSFQK
ncbi:hypothetical protein EHS89_16080 [Amphritea balenae]|uniref:DUF3718 domain-containing protein n=1 Tax=Amphritea balenae TaxID=452629 RepID=A0A3P1SKM3_9GAMM|nr:hypothetical protein [Amphritea balenae]RRC97698.1 hypothetical protein EHS89_16080 [Amphritea balenae]